MGARRLDFCLSAASFFLLSRCQERRRHQSHSVPNHEEQSRTRAPPSLPPSLPKIAIPLGTKPPSFFLRDWRHQSWCKNQICSTFSVMASVGRWDDMFFNVEARVCLRLFSAALNHNSQFHCANMPLACIFMTVVRRNVALSNKVMARLRYMAGLRVANHFCSSLSHQ